MSSNSERLWKFSGNSSSGRGGGSSSNHHDKNTVDTEDTATVMDMVMMLSCQDPNSAQRILLAMAGSAESCQALRKAGCISLLIQILHPINVPPDDQPVPQTKLRAAQTLKNVVQLNCDEKAKRKEMRVLKLLESLRSYIDYLKRPGSADEVDPAVCEKHPIPSSTALMKLSFDEDHRNVMCLLGAIHTLADLIQTDHACHGISDSPDCVTLRRYSGMTLTNLTVGDKRNKLLLGTMREFMIALVAQLDSPSEDVCQVTASVLRNLSWHASSALKASLVDSNAVCKLMLTAIKAKKESTLRAALSALWNLSAHSHANKLAICHTPDAIDFLVSLLESGTLTIVENAGGILTNISIVATTDESTKESFRCCGILEILLDHLQSSSILVVGNACGMLWHLSNCELNQQKLIQLGAVRKLKVLAGSKHERIKHGACSTLRNILHDRDLPVPVQPTTPDLTLNLSSSSQPSEQQQPMDLRTTTNQSSHDPGSSLKPTDLSLMSEPLDLSFHSSQSTPIHTVSATEFSSSRVSKGIPFLNPPLQSKNAFSYDSPKNYNSCPEFVRYLQPAHKSSPVDFSQELGNGVGSLSVKPAEDATINYSLHFPEPVEDQVGPIKNEDTVKTYYCEGTPLNFSTSNSMTDLTQVEKPSKLKPIIETETTDDLPRKYCTESTPATFSRASSLSSITSNLQGGENKAEYFEEPNLTNGTSSSIGANCKDKGKRNVTFSAADTPLMFSRTSSVNSLESVDITYEDNGSVVSEFSRRVSEVVSPSELPDSPRQIEPPQPMRFDTSAPNSMGDKKDEDSLNADTVKVFATTGESCAVSGIVSARSLSPLTIDDSDTKIEAIQLETMKIENNEKPANTDTSEKLGADETKIFGVEDTPWHGASTATSLSDLVDEMEKEEMKDTGNEKDKRNPLPLQQPLTPPPPPLPPKPSALKMKQEPPSEPVYVDTSSAAIEDLAQVVVEAKAITVDVCKDDTTSSPQPPPHPQRLPKSKSELSKLNTKAIKMSTSYHENLKRENQLDPDLAALIMKGKSRVKGNKATTPSSAPKILNGKASILEKKLTRLPAMSVTDPAVKNLNEERKSDQSEILKLTPEQKILQESSTSMASEWNQDSLSLSIPSLTISTAFKLAHSGSTIRDDQTENDTELSTTVPPPPQPIGILETSNMILQQSTISNVVLEGVPLWNGLLGVKKNRLGTETSNLYNQKPPPEFDLDNSMISVASLKTEIASIGPLEEGMRELSIGETYTIGLSGEGTDAEEESLFEETESFSSSNLLPYEAEKGQTEQNDSKGKASPRVVTDDQRFLTYTAKKQGSPRQKRKEDPGRYLTRTLEKESSPPFLSTFRSGSGTGTPRIVKPVLSATSNESSPSSSPKGIRGRRKPLYSSLPPQKRHGPCPIVPPKPTVVGVRPTRTSELRAASSRETSPKSSSRNSSTGSLNGTGIPPIGTTVAPSRKTPPKPPVRTATVTPSSTFRNFAVVRAVRTSNSSIGFSSGMPEGGGAEPQYKTLPRSLKVTAAGGEGQGKEHTKVGKLTTFWNHLMKGKGSGDFHGKTTSEMKATNGNRTLATSTSNDTEKKSKFGFHFGRKKKTQNVTGTNWIAACPEKDTNGEGDSAGILSATSTPGSSTFTSKMTPV